MLGVRNWRGIWCWLIEEQFKLIFFPPHVSPLSLAFQLLGLGFFRLFSLWLFELFATFDYNSIALLLWIYFCITWQCPMLSSGESFTNLADLHLQISKRDCLDLIVALVFAIYWGSVSSTEGLLLIKFRRRLHYVVVVVPWKIRVVTPPWIVCTREGIVAKSMLVLLLPIIVGNEVDSLL